jgi:hypothetical protein
LTADQQALVHAHMGLAHYHANRFRSFSIEQADKDQVARYGLCRAAAGFEGNLTDFPRFASAWILGCLKREHEHRARLRLGDQVAFEVTQVVCYSEHWLHRRSDSADRGRIIPRRVAFAEYRMAVRA